MHLPFKGGPDKAKELGCQTLQIFCGNPRGWHKSPLDPEVVKEFQNQLLQYKITPLTVHATYLINLAAPNDKIYQLSRDSFVMEVRRAAQLGAQFYVVHPGSHLRAGAKEGRERIAACVREAVAAVPKGPLILLENTAGGGSSLGGSFDDLALIMEEAKTSRLGICLDTCHTLSAGYDIRTPAGVKETLDLFDRALGLKRLHCLHINDSKGAPGSHLDRHEHIGAGQIGETGFRAFFGEERLWKLPAILETPREKPEDDLHDLRHAVKIARQAGATIDD